VENYVINNKTIALLKENNKTIIYDVDNKLVFNTHINKIIKYNCNYYGASLKGRKKSAKEILNIKYKIPIVLDEMNNIAIIQLSSPRNKECLFISVNSVIDYRKCDNFLEIICLNNQIFKVNISKYNFEKMLLKTIRLNNILKYRKSTKFLL